MNQTASITRIKYGATVLLNADTDYRQYNPGDALVYDNRTLLEISEDSVCSTELASGTVPFGVR